MAKIDIKSEELVLNNDEIKGKLRDKLNSIVSEVYKLVKEYKKSYNKSSNIDANLEITINEDEFKINMTIDKNSKVISKASCTNNGFTLVQNIELNDELANSTKENSKGDEKVNSKSSSTKTNKDFADENMSMLQHIMTDIKMNISDNVICKKYNVSKEVIDNIRTKFNLEKKKDSPAVSDKRIVKKSTTIKDRLIQYKEQIIFDIVSGKMMNKDIAQKYQVLPPYISKFKNDFAEEIKAAKAELEANNAKILLDKLNNDIKNSQSNGSDNNANTEKVKESKPEISTKDKESEVPDIDSDLEASIIEELISQTPILTISKKYNVPNNTIINILNFNRELINRAMKSNVTVPKVDNSGNGNLATEDDLKALVETFKKDD